MTPVFLPKRKQFGFLKPPPSFETATNRNQFSKSIEEEINSNNKSEQSTESIEADKSPLPTPLVKSRDVQTCTAKNFNLINYNFDSLPQIDEEKFKPQDKFVSTVSKIRQQKPGVSVMQLKAYQDFIQRSANIKALLRLPFNMQNQNIRVIYVSLSLRINILLKKLGNLKFTWWIK